MTELTSELRDLLPVKGEIDWITDVRLVAGYGDYSNLFHVTIDTSKKVRLLICRTEPEKIEVCIEVYKVFEMVQKELSILEVFQVCIDFGLNRLEHCEKNMLAIDGYSTCAICNLKCRCSQYSPHEWEYDILQHLLEECTGLQQTRIESAPKI